ncbi:hypothetical protein JX265_010441 [Neoarthrinium moseri]|uniref:Uncharacterized protein n=1 Tax=Neoarthrinium moseri TaxID=1658444 RepID=A0A9P9WEJ8_9PEZI|nr:uncharacterized protein JN550_006299 [Neoarthrinium moseri]KAI1840969.1 hypothetical protein JX266_012829 [Neoarthrinium moseri]KAI1859438.1 hypothetical protein JX265_010441 [Neoarthrinium moseri]KAI1868724.1 hypothetical protein JN550_006299 [Neoarthrinium moseri]
MTAPEVSHGRGGAGNINPDDTQYVDGEIVRTGEHGTQNAGAYSTGRGGGGNIGDAGIPPTVRTDKDVVPEAAVRPSQDEDIHTGRGGAGNVHLGPEHKKKKVTDGAPHDEATASHISVADKLKSKVLGAFKK